MPEPALEALAASWRRSGEPAPESDEGRAAVSGNSPSGRGDAGADSSSRYADLLPPADPLTAPLPVAGASPASGGAGNGYERPGLDQPADGHPVLPRMSGYFTPVADSIARRAIESGGRAEAAGSPWAPAGAAERDLDPSARAQYDEPDDFPEYREVARPYVDPGRHTRPAGHTHHHHLEPARPEEQMSWAEPPRYGALALPQRVPSKPDVPPAPDPEQEPVGDLLPAEVPELSRIASYLRDEEARASGEDGEPVRPDGFDIPAVIAAVRVVPGVREAQLRTNPTGLHTLRLELADDADPGLVSREVARLLKERMGLAAEPNDAMEAIDALLGGDRRPVDRVASALGEVPTSSVPASTPPGTPSPARLAGAPTSAPAFGRDPRRPWSAMPRRAAEGRTDERQADDRRADERRSDERRAEAWRPSSEWLPEDEARRVAAAGAGVTAYPGELVPGAAATAAPGPLPGVSGGARVVIEQVDVATQGTEATVEVRLNVNGVPAFGTATGPSFDGYVLRLAAVAATGALDELLAEPDGSARGRCFVEHAAVVPFGSCEVAIVVLLFVCGSWVEQLAGSAMVGSDPRQAVVRATLSAVNRRLEALLP